MADPFPPSRRTRIMRIALAISLAVNLAVAGLALGFALRGHDGKPPRDFDMSLGPVARALLPEDRLAIRNALKTNPDMPQRRPRADDIADLVAALSADPYDSQALRATLAQPVGRAAKVQDIAATVLADRIDAMSPADRLALAGRLQQSDEKRPER
ncbi:periplasmic heavy metal sensor [Loktanella salsilacus]|uniref:periplasmic heavy metal sensor n=1 Tax=Loktanella salsilacus TaxID=195913 RepID=UPI003735987A